MQLKCRPKIFSPFLLFFPRHLTLGSSLRPPFPFFFSFFSFFFSHFLMSTKSLCFCTQLSLSLNCELPWWKHILFIIVPPIPKHATWYCRSSKPICSDINSWWAPVAPQALCQIQADNILVSFILHYHTRTPWSAILVNSCILLSLIYLCQIPRLSIVTIKSFEDIFISSKVNKYYKIVTDHWQTYK